MLQETLHVHSARVDACHQGSRSRHLKKRMNGSLQILRKCSSDDGRCVGISPGYFIIQSRVKRTGDISSYLWHISLPLKRSGYLAPHPECGSSDGMLGNPALIAFPSGSWPATAFAPLLHFARGRRRGPGRWWPRWPAGRAARSFFHRSSPPSRVFVRRGGTRRRG
jgi:hypothetical protein